jgi:succinate dehydrogenase/fumarate reductase flavoprotein subunit
VFDHYCDLAEEAGLGLISSYSNTSKSDWEDNDEWFREYRTAMSFGDPSEGIIIDIENFRFLEYHLVEMLANAAQANGAVYAFNTRAQQLVTDADGTVTGVVCTNEDGEYVQYNATKGVVLACGDISGNDEMKKAFCPIALRADSVAYFPAKGNLGDGINMGCWVGAAVSKSTAGHVVHPISDSPLTCLDMSWLAVNRNGERFCAEIPFEPYVTNARMNQPGNVAWNIYDGKFKERVMQQEPNTGEALLDGIDETIENCKGTDLLYVADTLEDLADQLGIPAETFTATVARYNEMCAAGTDLDFAVPARFLAAVEEPPFYAVPMPAQTLAIPFGLHVDNNSQVCTEEDEPVAGLFAVGNVQGDFFGCSYPVFCPGLSHGRALTFGTLVGRALANDTVLTA